MRLDFDYIDLCGVRSFIEPAVLEFKALGPGLHLVRGINELAPDMGSNGSGKSTIWHALCWCLTGQTLNKLRTPDIRPWYGDAEPSVCVGLTYGSSGSDGKTGDYERTPGKFVRNGQPCEPPISAELLANAIILGQGRKTFFDHTPAGKMDIMSDVLGLERWDKRIDYAAKRAAALERECETWLTKLDALAQALTAANDDYERARRMSQDWEEKRARRAASTSEQISKARGEYEAAQAPLDEARLQLDGATTELAALKRERARIEADIAAVQKNYDDFSNMHNKALVEVALWDAQLKALMPKSGVCSSCGQRVTADHLERHRADIRRKLSAAQREADRVKVPPRTIALLSEHKEKLGRIVRAEREFERKAEAAQSSVNALTPLLSDRHAALRRLEGGEAERQREDNPYAEQLSALARRRQDIERTSTEAERSLKLAERRCGRANFWARTGMKELKLQEVEEFLASLEFATACILDDIGLAGWRVRYSIEKPTKSGSVKSEVTVSIFSPDNQDWVKWEVWSGGEAQRLRIAGALAFADVLLAHAGIEPNIEVLDEVTDRMSPEGVACLVEFLSDRAIRSGKALFFTDQNSVESAEYASIITVRKGDAGSLIDGGRPGMNDSVRAGVQHSAAVKSTNGIKS